MADVEWWTREDMLPQARQLEKPRQMVAGTVDGMTRPAHIRQALMLPRGGWKGAVHVLVIRIYEDGTVTVSDTWSIRGLL